MAQQVVVEMVDDLDGTVGGDVTTVSFALDGRSYEIDLCERNAARLRAGLAEFVEAARRPRGGSERGGSERSGSERSGRRVRSAATNADQSARQRAQAIREWAHGAGHQLSERGRIPANVVEAYEQAHRSGQESPSNSAPKASPEAPAPATASDAESPRLTTAPPANLPSFSG